MYKPLRDYPDSHKPPLDDPAGDVEMVDCGKCDGWGRKTWVGDDGNIYGYICRDCGGTGEIEYTDEMRQEAETDYRLMMGDD